MQHKTFSLQSIDDWQQVVSFLEPELHAKSLFLLEGDLGAGKTTFVSLVAKKMGIPIVSSPTFSLIQQHKNLVHVDLYRLESMDEIDATGFWEIFEDEAAIAFVEWASKISEDLWPLDWNIIKININKKSETEREVVIEKI